MEQVTYQNDEISTRTTVPQHNLAVLRDKVMIEENPSFRGLRDFAKTFDLIIATLTDIENPIYMRQ